MNRQATVSSRSKADRPVSPAIPQLTHKENSLRKTWETKNMKKYRKNLRERNKGVTFLPKINGIAISKLK